MTQLEQSERDGSRSSRSAGSAEKALVDQILGIAREAARRTGTAERSGGRAGERRPERAPSATQLLNDLRELQARACTSCRASRRSSCRASIEQAVAAVVADWTGIPVGRMVKNEIETVLKLADTLEPARHRPATTRSR